MTDWLAIKAIAAIRDLFVSQQWDPVWIARVDSIASALAAKSREWELLISELADAVREWQCAESFLSRWEAEAERWAEESKHLRKDIVDLQAQIEQAKVKSIPLSAEELRILQLGKSLDGK